ncbi:MAG: recombination regulator RecX [Candidatus Accumulibacter sp.]|jgi:regulatory protein|nr:recombination regulator RecX [Accumulibacter sp.]
MPAKTSLRERALRLLSLREHSRGELFRKLSPHAETPEALAGLLDDLSARNLLSDARYAHSRAEKQSARYGNRAVALELRARGIDGELVAETLAALGDEAPRARSILCRKFGDSPPSDIEERVKRARFLTRRGFSGETVRKAMRCDFEGE